MALAVGLAGGGAVGAPMEQPQLGWLIAESVSGASTARSPCGAQQHGPGFAMAAQCSPGAASACAAWPCVLDSVTIAVVSPSEQAKAAAGVPTMVKTIDRTTVSTTHSLLRFREIIVQASSGGVSIPRRSSISIYSPGVNCNYSGVWPLWFMDTGAGSRFQAC